jgi:predicted aldo/keto reductase-like oxidoreductase
MNSLEMVEENVRTAEEALPGTFTAEDHALIDRVRNMIRAREKVGCTACRYCMPCPKGVDIPGIFRSYNAMYTEGKTTGRFQFAQNVGMTRQPAFATQCVGCGKCESHCPQGIPIREKLKEADRALRPLPYKVGINIARAFMLREGRQR